MLPSNLTCAPNKVAGECVCVHIYKYIICIKKMMTFFKSQDFLLIFMKVNTLPTVFITNVEIIYNAKLQYYINLKVIFT